MVQSVSPEKASTLVADLADYCQNMTGSQYSVRITSMQTMLEQMNDFHRLGERSRTVHALAGCGPSTNSGTLRLRMCSAQGS